MKDVRDNKLHVRAHVRSRDEIGELAGTFNSMMDRIEGLMEEVKEEEKQKREAEQNVLAAQIQPHFVYNAISAVQYVARMRGQEDINDAAGALSRLLRSVLGNRDEFITLWEEREYIESYMTLQRFKFQGGFPLTWEVEEELWTFRIPKLLLQPIVENALIHGVAPKGSGTISVQAYTQGEKIVLKVIDDGEGIEEDVIRRLAERRSPGEGMRPFRNVGLPNVFGRLDLIYGEEASYGITGCPGLFTCVEMRIPRERRTA